MNTPNQRLVLTPHAVKRHSRRLQNEIQDLFKDKKLSEDFNLAQAQNMFSRILGMKDYHEMSKVLFNEEKSNEIVINNQNNEEEQRQIEEKIQKITYVGHQFEQLLYDLIYIGKVSSITLQTETNPIIEINKINYCLENIKLTSHQIKQFISSIYGDDGAIHILNSGKDINTSYSLKSDRESKLNFIVNITTTTVGIYRGYSIYLLRVNNDIADIKTIIYNEELIDNLDIDSGIVFSCGSENTTKREILHSFLQYKINKVNKKFAIYDIESTFFDYKVTKSSISYTHIGSQIETIEKAIINARRRHIDYAFIGEIRSKEDLKELILTKNTNTKIYTTMVGNSLESSLMRLLGILGSQNKEEYLELLQSLSLIIQNHNIIENDKIITIHSYLKLTDNIKTKLEDFIYNHFESHSFNLYIKELVNKYAFTYTDALEEALDKKIISPKTYKKYIEDTGKFI